MIPDTLDPSETLACQIFGTDPRDALYRALWIALWDSGLDDIIQDSADDFRAYYDHGGYPNTLIRLDPLANPSYVSYLRQLYGLSPNADWDTIQAAIRDDYECQYGTLLWDPVTDQTFLEVH